MDNLKTIIIALNQKVKTRDDIEANLKSIMASEAENATAREDLREQLLQAAASLKEQQAKN